MRRFVLALLALALCAPAALAVNRDEAAEIARKAVPGAELVRVERDGGAYEVLLRGEDARYEVEVSQSTGAVLEREAVYSGAGRGRKFALTEDEARAAAAAVAPEAERGYVLRERGDDGDVYELFYAAAGAVGAVTVNAETGAIVRAKLYPEAAERGVMDAAEVERRIAERLPGARLEELELGRDGDGYRYEGEAEAGGARYGFELDATTGEIIEFERDD